MQDSTSINEWLNSPYYQLLYNVDNIERSEFVNSLVRKLKLSTESKMLHIGCGTGQYTRTIAESGVDVTGIDLSFEAIDQAKQFENERIHFFQHDLRLPFWINYFDHAFSLFLTIGYFKTRREYNNSIRTISQSLQFDGMVIMDCLNVHYEKDHLESNQEKTIGNVHFDITNRQDDEYFYKQIQVTQAGFIKQQFNETIMKLSVEDFTDMFARQGLQIQEMYGDYNFSDYEITQSPRLIFIAKKIKR